MNILDEFDVSKFKLGKLCIRNHEYRDTGKTLRQASNHQCPDCNNLLRREKRNSNKKYLQCCLCNQDVQDVFAKIALINGKRESICKQCEKNRLVRVCKQCLTGKNKSEFYSESDYFCKDCRKAKQKSKLQQQNHCEHYCFLCSAEVRDIKKESRPIDGIDRILCKDCAKKAKEKRCTQCLQVKALNDFHAGKRTVDGRRAYCKECHNNKYKDYRSPSEVKRREECRKQRKELISQLQAQSHKECSKCNQVKEKNKDNFATRKDSPDGFHTICRSCVNARTLNLRRSRGAQPKQPNLRDAKILESYVGVIDGAEDILSKGVYFLGSLCINSHQWEGTEYSLRRTKTGVCNQCSVETNRKLRSEMDENQKDQKKEKGRYLAWLKNPRVSPSVAELVEKSQRWALTHRKDLFMSPEEKKEYNREKLDAYKKRYRENPEKEKLRIKKWKHANPQRIDDHNLKRIETVRRKSDGSVTVEIVDQILKSAKDCIYCSVSLTPEVSTLDHIEPVSRGGLHSAFNLVACCRSCNSKKYNKPFHVWLNELPESNKQKALKLYRSRYGSDPLQGLLPLSFE